MASHPKVSVVLINWNQREHASACLASLQALDYPNCQVILVDNGSTDDSAALIEAQFPSVLVIRNGANLGFAEGNNVGIRKAIECEAAYVFLLNSDSVVASDALGILVQEAERAERVGMVGPTIYLHQEPGHVWKVGGTVDKLGRAVDLARSEPSAVTGGAPRGVDFVTGCAMLVKRDLIERAGLIDARFFAYYEELDWCMRAKRAGFAVLYVPRAKVWHKIDPQARGESPRVAYLMSRNRLLFLREQGFPAFVIVLHLAQMIAKELAQQRRVRKAVLQGIHDYFRGKFGEPSVAP